MLPSTPRRCARASRPRRYVSPWRSLTCGCVAPRTDVHGLGASRDDGGHRVDHIFDALVRREQAEGEEHGPAFDTELVLAGLGRRRVGDAVVDEVDFLRRCAVYLLEELGAVCAHDDDAFGELEQLRHGLALDGRRLSENRVERGDDRHAELTQEGEHVGARLATVDPVFVLHGQDVDRVDVEKVGGAPVRSNVAFGDFEPYARRIGVATTAVVHREDEAVDISEFAGNRL